ncbi:class I SAM-dependent methyltransferase [Occultella gossypii]|uniref:Class I SAM-dependent methyltransferase n=1 Tax=Occultella gossypii TaxID=2800820 RepID=A0ABS7SAY6_9MICO|nr:class I SAM-dependent methyltransferase [Occultella gossypii]MBZ2196418.1 class I SAM-dependent methyltransferase [Occultella gossypii]
MTGSIELADVSRALFMLSMDEADRAMAALTANWAPADDVMADLTAALATATASDRARALGDVFRDHELPHDHANECYRAAFYFSGEAEELSSNPLYAHYLAHRSGAMIDKWIHYFPVYHRHLERYRGAPVRVLEIGVYRGGGLDMWQRYFGPDATVVGLDVDEAAVRAVGGRYVVELGDQEDPEVLRRINAEHGPFDVIIDDGGHTMAQQIVTAETMFPLLRDGGTFIVEDCHTSYWDYYQGGLKRPGTFIEWVKDRLDDEHSRYHVAIDRASIWATHLDGAHVYDSVVVLDKAERFRPFSEVGGSSSYLRSDRVSESYLADALAARDQLQAELDAIRGEVSALRDEMDRSTDRSATEVIENDRSARLALQRMRRESVENNAELERLQADLASANGRLLESWEQIRLMRGSVSWRLTGPIRAVRRLMSR